MPPNWANRTLWTGDNLDILRGMNSECGRPPLPRPAVQLEPRLRGADRLEGGGRRAVSDHTRVVT